MVKMEPINLLLVEDDPADQKLIKLSLKNQRIANDIHCVSCGEEALDYLHHRNGFNGNAPKPDLILLDLNMPGMGGKEFLKLIKADEEQKTIPVIILTTSDSERDIIESYQLQASGYVHKPVTLDEFKGVMEKIEDYWFVMCRLPPKDC
jgi:two-component system, chemotaxis family, response regulator Rcp1